MRSRNGPDCLCRRHHGRRRRAKYPELDTTASGGFACATADSTLIARQGHTIPALNRRPKIFGAAHAAAALGVSKRTLSRWFAAGKVDETKRDAHGRRVFTDVDIDRIRSVCAAAPRRARKAGRAK